MLSKEYLDSWNELCAECKMVESDLANPTEAWLTKILISYLRMFGYRVEIPCLEEGTRERRQFLIKLVRHIDHIYKISDKSFTFTYYDLLRPTPKKTSHMLGTLLNYLYYMNMFKTNVFKMATDKLKERQELIDEIKYTIEDNQKRHNEAKNMQEQMGFLVNEIPQYKNKLKTVNSELKHRKSQTQQTTDAIKDLRTKTEELKGQIRNLKHLIVPEEEGKELQSQLSKFQENISECDQQIRNAESNLKTHIGDNDRLQEIAKLVECAKEVLSPDFVDNFSETVKKLDNTKEKIASNERETEQLSQLIIQHENALKSWQEKSRLDQRQYDEEKEKIHQIIISKTKVCDVSAAKADNLKDEILAIEASIDDQKDIHAYIQENVARLMGYYK